MQMNFNRLDIVRSAQLLIYEMLWIIAQWGKMFTLLSCWSEVL